MTSLFVFLMLINGVPQPNSMWEKKVAVGCEAQLKMIDDLNKKQESMNSRIRYQGQCLNKKTD